MLNFAKMDNVLKTEIMAKQVLVSGGAGYIGSHVAVELIGAGYDVVVADNMSNCDMTCFEGVKKITGRDDIPFERIDCCDASAVERIFTEHKIDAVIHFAAYKAVGESVAEPIMYCFSGCQQMVFWNCVLQFVSICWNFVI